MKLWIYNHLIAIIGLVSSESQSQGTLYATNTSLLRDEGSYINQTDERRPGSHNSMHAERCDSITPLLVNISKHYDDYDESQVCQNDIPANVWVMFTDEYGHHISILQLNAADNICMQPSYCGSFFPWYIYNQREDYGAALCTTTATSLGKSLCCQKPIPITILRCRNRIYYRLAWQMPNLYCGSPCMITKDRESSLMTDWLKQKYVTYHNYPMPRWVYDYSPEIIKNIITVTFHLEYVNRRRYKEIETMKALIKTIVAKWNADQSLIRFRRQSQDDLSTGRPIYLMEENVHNIKGSPSTVGLSSYYSFYIRDDNGFIIPAQNLVKFMNRRLLNTDVTMNGVSHISNISSNVANAILAISPTQTPDYSAEEVDLDDRRKDDITPFDITTRSWFTIIIVLCCTLGIALLMMLIALLCQHCKHKRKYQIQEDRTNGDRVIVRFSPAIKRGVHSIQPKRGKDMNDNDVHVRMVASTNR